MGREERVERIALVGIEPRQVVGTQEAGGWLRDRLRALYSSENRSGREAIDYQ
jgi:hypothetical protein